MSESVDNKKQRRRLDLVGCKFSKLTVIRFHGLDRRLNSYWECQCECGKKTVASGSNLKGNRVKSCGCLAKTKNPEAAIRLPEFKIWMGMRRRCSNHNMSNYHLYGGRGIKVCERWGKSFWDFYADMGPRPTNLHSIDRINTNGNYEPSNCRWATPKQQQRNRRLNLIIEAFGEKKTLAEWAEKTGISRSSIVRRMSRGLSAEQALTLKSANVVREILTPRGSKFISHCFRGHEYNKENTYIDKKGGRHCRACHSIRSRGDAGRSTRRT